MLRNVFTSNSQAVNDLIRKAREIEYIRAQLIRAEQDGFPELSAAEILAKSKEELWRLLQINTLEISPTYRKAYKLNLQT